MFKILLGHGLCKTYPLGLCYGPAFLKNSTVSLILHSFGDGLYNSSLAILIRWTYSCVAPDVPLSGEQDIQFQLINRLGFFNKSEDCNQNQNHPGNRYKPRACEIDHRLRTTTPCHSQYAP